MDSIESLVDIAQDLCVLLVLPAILLCSLKMVPVVISTLAKVSFAAILQTGFGAES